MSDDAPKLFITATKPLGPEEITAFKRFWHGQYHPYHPLVLGNDMVVEVISDADPDATSG